MKDIAYLFLLVFSLTSYGQDSLPPLVLGPDGYPVDYEEGKFTDEEAQFVHKFVDAVCSGLDSGAFDLNVIDHNLSKDKFINAEWKLYYTTFCNPDLRYFVGYNRDIVNFTFFANGDLQQRLHYSWDNKPDKFYIWTLNDFNGIALSYENQRTVETDKGIFILHQKKSFYLNKTGDFLYDGEHVYKKNLPGVINPHYKRKTKDT